VNFIYNRGGTPINARAYRFEARTNARASRWRFALSLFLSLTPLSVTRGLRARVARAFVEAGLSARGEGRRGSEQRGSPDAKGWQGERAEREVAGLSPSEPAMRV